MTYQQKEQYLAIAETEFLGEFPIFGAIPQGKLPLYVRSIWGNWFKFVGYSQFMSINDCDVPKDVRLVCYILDIPI